MKERCEDAPCCGCCGINIYGVNQEYDPYEGEEEYDYSEEYDDSED